MDIPKDSSLTILILFILIALFGMLIILPIIIITIKGIFYDYPTGTVHPISSVWDILFYIIFYLCCIAIILQDRTTIEIERDAITINRFLFGNVVVNKKEIIQKEIKRNILHTYRILLYIFILTLFGYLIYNAYYDIQRDILDNYPAKVLIFSFLPETLIMFFICILFLNLERRSIFPSLLKVTTSEGDYKFYTDDPKEFGNIIANQINATYRITP